ncbi:hypothetical protein CEW92_03455 [Bacillaceae bacterium SAS-127]|nr:hypothetical protein CEW92_03455 [Bacillaceae bacterium SAS-127]
MSIKFTAYVSNMETGTSHLLTNDPYNELDSAFVTSERTRYIPITHSEAAKAALKTCEEQEGPALYIPGYVQLTIDGIDFFTEEDWTTDLLMTWRDFAFLLDADYLDSIDETEVTLLDNQTQCVITKLDDNMKLKIERFLMPEDETIELDQVGNTIIETPLVFKDEFLQAIKEELENFSNLLTSEATFKEDGSYEDILELYNAEVGR